MSLPDRDPDLDTDRDPDVDPPEGRPDEPPDWRVASVIALGGAVGAVARYGLARALPTPTGQLPWATLVTNVVGSLLLGLLLGALGRASRPHHYLRAAIGTGVLGGFTTFSTLTSELRALAEGGHLALALLYAVSSLLLGCFAALVGLRLAGAGSRSGPGGALGADPGASR